MNSTEELASFAWEFARRVGLLFYIVNPRTTTFEKAEDVPNYIHEVSI